MFGLKSPATPSDPWPLRFKEHNFGARCFRTLKCSVIYDQFQFIPDRSLSAPSGEPATSEWKESWTAGYIVGDRFAAPVQVNWTSLDGTTHHAEVDLDAIFANRLVHHNVREGEIPDGWLAAWAVDPLPVHIMMEIDDRTISVYMRAHITTREPQIPGNPRSCHRRDLIQVWTDTY